MMEISSPITMKRSRDLMIQIQTLIMMPKGSHLLMEIMRDLNLGFERHLETMMGLS